MSAESLHVFTLAYPGVAVNPFGVNYKDRVDSSISFSYASSNNIRTLSTHAATTGSDRTGFLYVPELDEASACIDASAPYMYMNNVTRIKDLPSTAQVVAIAPWLSPDCTLSYLRSAQADRVTAFIFFLPDSTQGQPPAANDAAWGLGDGGQWKRYNNYPVYAIAAPPALTILNQLSLYSGNMTTAPYAADLRNRYPDTSLIRLFIDVDLGSTTGIPSIWIFLLIILVVLMTAVGFISCTMHFIQRRRRQDLRRRIVEGQVDVEALGIGRLTIPQETIDKMPLYPYSDSPPTTASSRQTKPFSTFDGSNADAQTSPQHLFQPTCAICLDDYVPSETNVRQLPCRHIYHPECIDTFLRENSSLCPLCKKSALPTGYVPIQITDFMIQRDRVLRRQRIRDAAAGRASIVRGHEERHSADPGSHMSSTEMTNMRRASIRPPASSTGRREWARRRALSMLGPHAPAEEDAQTQQISHFRRLLGRVFPGVG
jgi:hypothetical protein